MFPGRDGDAATTGNHDAGERAPLLSSYSHASAPPLAEHLLDKPPRAHWLTEQLSFCPTKAGGGASARVAINVDWASVRSTCKEWLTNPMNIALLLWLLCVGVSGGMMVLLLLGFLDGAFPTAASRNHWIEINDQVLNALFTLMSLYQHPSLCHDLFLLCRWRRRDAADLRASYCNGGGARPSERLHLAVVLALLQVTIVCQYVLCGLYWSYTKATRPEVLENGFFALGVAAPVAAVVYTVCSPLGKDPRGDLACSDDDDAEPMTAHDAAAGHVVVVEPEWAGGMFECGDDATAGCLALSCTFCVFGWNAERLGFGNAYVHMATFVLLCFAPLWVFGVSALHIHDVVIGDVVGGAGLLLCVCGLLYGGYWRIQMRNKFGLPGSAACCGSKSLTDYARWLFCWPCALAQEVRTASLYRIHGESFYRKADDDEPLLLSYHPAEFDAPGSGPDHQLVVVRDEMVAPLVQVVVVPVEDECNAVHDDPRIIESPIPVSVKVVEEERNVVDDEEKVASPVPVTVTVEADGSSLSAFNGELVPEKNWRVEKVKKLINMVTLVSFLILLYTRGFIR